MLRRGLPKVHPVFRDTEYSMYKAHVYFLWLLQMPM